MEGDWGCEPRGVPLPRPRPAAGLRARVHQGDVHPQSHPRAPRPPSSALPPSLRAESSHPGCLVQRASRVWLALLHSSRPGSSTNNALSRLEYACDLRVCCLNRAGDSSAGGGASRLAAAHAVQWRPMGGGNAAVLGGDADPEGVESQTRDTRRPVGAGPCQPIARTAPPRPASRL